MPVATSRLSLAASFQFKGARLVPSLGHSTQFDGVHALAQAAGPKPSIKHWPLQGLVLSAAPAAWDSAVSSTLPSLEMGDLSGHKIRYQTEIAA